jgi:hypothetical protein
MNRTPDARYQMPDTRNQQPVAGNRIPHNAMTGALRQNQINAKHLRPGRSLNDKVSPGYRKYIEDLDRGCPFFGTFFGQAKKVQKILVAR